MANTPAYILYHGKATGKDKAEENLDPHWHPLSNKSGNGFNITLEYMSLDEGVTVMLSYDKQQGEAHLVPDEQST